VLLISQSNIDCDAAPLRQILTKCSKIKHVYEVCVLNKRGKFGATICMHYTDIAIFLLGHFILTHPVWV